MCFQGVNFRLAVVSWTSLFWCPGVNVPQWLQCMRPLSKVLTKTGCCSPFWTAGLAGTWLVWIKKSFPAGTTISLSSAILLVATRQQAGHSKVLLVSLSAPCAALGLNKLHEAFPVLSCCSLRLAYHPRALLATKADEIREDTCVLSPTPPGQLHGSEIVYSISICQLFKI